MIPCKGLGRETPLCVACQLPGKFLVYRSRCKLEPVPSCFHHPFGGPSKFSRQITTSFW